MVKAALSVAMVVDAVTDMSDERWVSITEFAALYGIDRVTVYKWLKAGLLEFYRVKGDDMNIIRIRNLPPNRHAPQDPSSSAHVGGR